MRNILIILLVLIPFFAFASEEGEYQAAVHVFNSGDRLEAQGLFEKFISDYPESKYVPNSIYYLGRLEKDPERALELYNMVVEKYSKSDVADNALYEVAQYHYAIGAYQTAIEKYKDLVSSYKKSEMACNAQYWMANALIAIQDYDKAVEEYRNVKVKYPGCDKVATAELGIAQAYFRLGKFREASVQYRTILNEQSDPGVLAAALYGLGECSEKTAQFEQAIYSYERLIEDFPASQETAHAKVRLVQLRKQYQPKKEVAPQPPKSEEPEEATDEETDSEESAEEKEKNYTIQAGAFREEENASQVVQTLIGLGYDAKLLEKPEDKTVPFKVWVGEFETRAEAEETAEKLKQDSPNISTFVLKIE